MNVLQFEAVFLMLTILSSCAIVGFYIVSRGSWEITPDGKEKRTGMLFKHWSIFFEQYRNTKAVYYEYEGLRQKFEFLKKVHPKIASKLSFDNILLAVSKENPLTDGEVKLIEDALLCRTNRSTPHADFDQLFLLTDEPIFDWPEWIRKPFSSCPTCMAGPYGTGIWLAFLKLQRDAFSWTDFPVLAYIVFGLIFLLTLSTFNNFITRKMNL
jgi:hypothetical protein